MSWPKFIHYKASAHDRWWCTRSVFLGPNEPQLNLTLAITLGKHDQALGVEQSFHQFQPLLLLSLPNCFVRWWWTHICIEIEILPKGSLKLGLLRLVAGHNSRDGPWVKGAGSPCIHQHILCAMCNVRCVPERMRSCGGAEAGWSWTLEGDFDAGWTHPSSRLPYNSWIH